MSEPPPDTPPQVSAGADITVEERAAVLIMAEVDDPDGEPDLLWQQLSGPPVALAVVDDLVLEFQAPSVDEESTLEFRLTASDGVNGPVSDTVAVRVIDRPVVISTLNPPGSSYIDPEVHPLRGELVYQTGGEVWVGEIDLATGRFVSETGRDHYVGDTLSLTLSRNGPEYGLDADGVAVFFNTAGTDGSTQFSRAMELGTGRYQLEQLTPDGVDRINQLPSQDASSPSTYLNYARLVPEPEPGGASGFIAYLNEDTPGDDRDLTPLRPGFAGFRWLRGSTLMTTTIADTGPHEGQILLVDAATGEQRVVTDDAGIKFDPYAWFAPEYGGVIAVQATVNETDIAVYVDRGAGPFEKVAVLTPPDSTALRYVQSAEPFVSTDGVSYISLTLKDDPGSVFTDVSESEIWIYGIADGNDGQARFVLNCGDGVPGKVRHEAEMVSGDSQVLVYYNELLPSGQFDLVLCESGLTP